MIIYSIFIENSQKNIDTKHSNTLNKLSIHKDRLKIITGLKE